MLRSLSGSEEKRVALSGGVIAPLLNLRLPVLRFLRNQVLALAFPWFLKDLIGNPTDALRDDARGGST